MSTSPAQDMYSVSVLAAQSGVRGNYRLTGGRKIWPRIEEGRIRLLAQMKETQQRNSINKVMPSANYERPGVRQNDSWVSRQVGRGAMAR